MNITEQELLSRMALTLIDGVGDLTARRLISEFGSADSLFSSKAKDLLKILPSTSQLTDSILNRRTFIRAEQELEFTRKNAISVLTIGDEHYPYRMKDCPDVPLIVYFKGNANLNAAKIISLVGTRKATHYGCDFCNLFAQQIACRFPDVCIVSGLAYGIDIAAHKASLQNNLSTVGVLAHGLDRIYPSSHRRTAVDMLAKGGLLTEFTSGNKPERFNFVRRNRIIAGMADAVIVVESDVKGGSLITAEIANSYCKDVFAVPGRVNDAYSIGCNKLIAAHKADLFQSVDYFIEQMNWEQVVKPIQQELFEPELSEQEKLVVTLLKSDGKMSIDLLIASTGISSYLLLPVLLEMELKNIIVNLPGNMYDLR